LEARDFVIANLAEVVGHEMNNIPSAQLRQGYPGDLPIKQIRFRQERFKAYTDRLYSHVLQLFCDVSNKVERDIHSAVQRTCRTAFLGVCAARLIPECKDMILVAIKADIEHGTNEMEAENAGFYDFTPILVYYISAGAS
jgi:hypothetical protein